MRPNGRELYKKCHKCGVFYLFHRLSCYSVYYTKEGRTHNYMCPTCDREDRKALTSRHVGMTWRLAPC
jgi:anaerobic ribonucleoside-triphosphate reductase